MQKLSKALADYGTDSLAQVLKRAIESLEPGTLPLAQATTQGGYVDDSHISASILSVAENERCIEATAGVFFRKSSAGAVAVILRSRKMPTVRSESPSTRQTARRNSWCVPASPALYP